MRCEVLKSQRTKSAKIKPNKLIGMTIDFGFKLGYKKMPNYGGYQSERPKLRTLG